MLDIAAAAIRLLLYLGALGSAGTVLAAVSLRRGLGNVAKSSWAFVWPSAVVLAFASVLNALVLAARLGDFSGPTLSAILSTRVGAAAGMQFMGAILLLSVRKAGVIRTMVGLAGAGAVFASFGVSGHASAVSVGTGIAAFVHVGAAAWWFGALLLLRESCRCLSRSDMVLLVRSFSRYAMAIVGVLVAMGVGLIVVLVDLSQPDWFTSYVLTLVLKIAFVACLLGLAIYNKICLTPRLPDGSRHGVRALRVSITVELIVIRAVLATTAWLVTFYSPYD